MIRSWLFLLVFLALAAVASRNFFTWPKPAEKTPLRLRHILAGVILLFLPGLLPFITGSHSDVTARSLHGVFLACAFIFYLLSLPIDITRSVIYSGNKPRATCWRAIFSACRMWVIVIPITQIVGLVLSKLLIFIFPVESLQEQTLTQEVQDTLTSTVYDRGFILSVGILIPFAEEIFFRGFLQTFLKNKMNRVYALLYSSVIFALTHVEHSWGSLVFVPILLIFSLCTGFLYEKERHIVAPIVLHMLFNMTNIGMLSV
ncbi:CPBP family intramembrane glutamic endopeptidase [Chlamydia vaughanii]|uniref:CPBP family intramembrane glutamic endopeptidase n=1 Tax=Chlamydia vaughanii TaxID=3112552 RepID=UPI0032B2A36B